ncbi:hypothetical protein ACWEPH_00610 [Nocardia beijingensis]
MTTKAAISAGTQAEAIDYGAGSAQSQTRALSLKYDYLRTNVDMFGADVHVNHNHMRQRELRQRTVEKATKDVPALLTELAYDRGMAWVAIADVVRVSVSAVRKWRKGGAATPEKRRALARFAAMLDMVEEKGAVGDPAAWMEMDLPFEDAGYYIRPLDLYLKGYTTALLDIAERRKGVEEALDEVEPGWRGGRSKFEVYADTDGDRALRLRGD